MAANFYTVRVHVRIPERSDAYFDLTNVAGDCEDEAVGYAVLLSTECFGLPLRLLDFRINRVQPIIDL
jgi:hypothetical protein